MQIFGITLNRYSAPIIYLACAIVGFLLIRESAHMFQHPVTTRAISVMLAIGFIALSLPAIYSSKIVIPRKAIALLTTWLVWTLLSTLLGDQPWPAMVRWFEIFTSVLIALCLYFIISQQPTLITLLAKSIVAAVLLCLLAFIVYWNLLSDPIKHNWVSDIPFFVNIRHFGQLIAVAVPLGYFLLHQYSTDKKSTHWIMGYLILSWALVFWLGGRGTFLAVSITTILYGYISQQDFKRLLLPPVIGLVISLFFIVDNPSLNLLRHVGDENASLNAISSSRIEIFTESLLHWWQVAPLMGIGADGFFYIIPAIGTDSMAHPHSSIIQLLLAFGPIGLFIPSYFFFVLSQHIIKSKPAISIKTPLLSKTFYLVFLSTMILSLVDGILYHAYGLFISSIVAGICIALAWPQYSHYLTPDAAKKQNTTSKTNTANIATTTLITMALLLTSAYLSVFTYQLYHSKNSVKDEDWINWNARYPLYFSPTWTYQRYKAENIEQLKQDYIKRLNSK